MGDVMPVIERDKERRAKLLALLMDHDARDADILMQKIERLYGRAR